MKFIQVVPPSRIKKKPDKTIKLITNGNFVENGFKIKNLELCYYSEGNDSKCGAYSLITTFLETDQASIEMTYDEGYRGNNPLEGTAKFLVESLGLSAIILRATIALHGELKQNNT